MSADSDEPPTREQMLLRLAAQLLQPLARLLLLSGVKHGASDDVWRVVFIDTARQLLNEQGMVDTVSAVSLATGLHRREVKRIMELPRQRAIPTESSAVSELVTRWLTDARFLTSARKPRRLRRHSPSDHPSFDDLARSVSQDVHPRSQLDELRRLGLVEATDDWVSLKVTSFVPPAQERELLELVALNVHDHLAAAVHNLTQDGPKFLEQSIFADHLSEEAAAEVVTLAREQWRSMLLQLVPRIEALVEQDRVAGRKPARRARIGMFGYHAPGATTRPTSSSARAKAKAARGKAR